MAKRILLIHEVHIGNLGFVYALSFRFKVYAYRIHPLVARLLKNRVDVVALEEFFDADACAFIHDEAAAYWGTYIQPALRSRSWEEIVGRQPIDLYKKAGQILQQKLAEGFFLQRIQQKYREQGAEVLLLSSVYADFLEGIDAHLMNSAAPGRGALSFINIQLDKGHWMMKNVAVFLSDLKAALKETLVRVWRRGRGRSRLRVKFIWDGISPRELSVDRRQNTFAWIVDNTSVRAADVLFILPRPDFQMAHFSIAEARRQGYNLVFRDEIASCVSLKRLWSALAASCGCLLRGLLRIGWGAAGLIRTDATLHILRWGALIDEYRPMAYVTSFSMVGNENPVTLYARASGVKTLMWCYGTNSYLFTTSRPSALRACLYGNILSAQLLVWNKHFADFIGAHPQEGLTLVPIGPLMPGDEPVCASDRSAMLRQVVGEDDRSLTGGTKWVAFFDAPPVDGKFAGNSARAPDPNTEEYNFAFIRDILRLLEDYRDMRLLYKPKRSLTSGKFNYSPQLKSLFEAMEKDSRVVVLDYNINPWLPIALADMTIGLPFESPFIAGLHYGKPGIFHDPTGEARFHRYARLAGSITHSYEELKEKVRDCLFISQATPPPPHLWQEFTGASPMNDSSGEFRRYLLNGINVHQPDYEYEKVSP